MMKSNLQQLKAQAHHLKPVVMIGSKGLTPAIAAETNIALTAHELIKVKISGVEKDEKLALIDTLCGEVQAELVQLIGNTAIIYRPNPQ